MGVTKQATGGSAVGMEPADGGYKPSRKTRWWRKALVLVALVSLTLPIAVGAVAWGSRSAELDTLEAELNSLAVRLDDQSARLSNQASAVDSHDDQLAVYDDELAVYDEDLDALASASSWNRWEIDYRSRVVLRKLDELAQRAYSVERIVRQTPNVSAVGDLLEASVVKVLTDSGQGTGFRLDIVPGCADGPYCALYEAEGYDTVIVTNYHVVAGVTEPGYGARIVTVVAPDGSRAQGRVWGWDEWADLAIIDIDRSDLDRNVEPLLWTTTPSAEIGDWVAVGGHPLGWEFIVATGYLADEWEIGWEADATVSPGSSGSPVVDTFGRVIGVATRRDEEGKAQVVPIYLLCSGFVLDCSDGVYRVKQPARLSLAEIEERERRVTGLLADSLDGDEDEAVDPPGEGGR